MNRRDNRWINTLFKYIVTHIVIVVFVVGALMPIYFSVLKNEKQNKIYETYMHLKNSSYGIQNQINRTNSFLYNLRTNRDVVKLSLIDDSNQSKNLYLLNISYYLKDTLFDNTLESEIILQFRENNVLLTPGRVFDNKEIFYKRFFEYEDMSYEDWQEKLYSDKQYMWSSMNVVNSDQSKFAAFTINSYYPSTLSPVIVVSIVIPEQILWNLVMTNEIKEDGFVYLIDSNSDIIASYNYDGAPLLSGEPIQTIYVNNIKHTVFTIGNFDYGLKIVAGIPNNVYEQAVVPVKNIIITYIIVALVIAIIFSFIFSYLNYSPLKSIATFISKLRVKNAVESTDCNTDDNNNHSDIYDYIKTAIADITSSKESLKQAFDTIKHNYKMKIFRDAVYGNTISETDKNTLIEEHGALKGNYILLVIAFEDTMEDRDKSESKEYYEFAVEKIIMDNFTNACAYNIGNLCVVINIQQNGGCETVKDKLRNINRTLNSTMNLNIFFGISNVYDSIEYVSDAYNEALNCVAIAKSVAENYMISYGEIPPANNDNPIELSDYYLLFNLLMVGDRAGVKKLFDNISTKLYNNIYVSPKRLEMIYYNIISVFSSVTEKLPMENGISINDGYDLEAEGDELINQLLETSILICNAIEEQKDKQRLKLREEILDFLNINFNQPELCLAMIAERFNISERYASQFIKEQTGKNYTQHVEELRMQEAQRLLKETDIPINRIAEMVGYYNKNTFYKSFKRVYNTSPKIYRESFRDLNQ